MYFESTQHDINFQLDHKTKSNLFMSLKNKYYDMVIPSHADSVINHR